MAQDQDVGASHEVGGRRDGLHHDGPALGITETGILLQRLLGLLALPYVEGDVVDKGQLQLVVAEGHGRQLDPLHDRIAVFQAVAQAACGGIDDDLVQGQAQILQQDVDLLGQIDVDGGGGHRGVAVAHDRGADALVGHVLDGTDDEVLSGAVLRDLPQHLGILVRIRRAPDDQGDIDGLVDLLHLGHRVRGADVVLVGIGAPQVETDEVRPVFLDALLGPGRGIANDVLEGLPGRLGPILGVHVPDLHGDLGLVGHLALELVKGQTGLPADLDRVVPFAQLDLLDRPGILLLDHLEAHNHSLFLMH